MTPWTLPPDPFIREELESNPAVRNNTRCSVRRRDKALGALQDLRGTLRAQLEGELFAAVATLRENWTQTGMLPMVARFHLYLRESLLGCDARASIPKISLNISLQQQALFLEPTAEKHLLTEPVEHPAVHWKVEYESRLAAFERAVDAGDVLEACVQLQLFVNACDRNWLLTPLVVYQTSTPRLVSVAPSAWASDSAGRASATSTRLANFLAMRLSTPTLRIEPAALEELIVEFFKTHVRR